MATRAKDLADRLRAFNNEIIAFVEKCTEEEWRKHCPSEDWTVGVVARHIGAGHYGILDLVKMIIAGEKLPEITERAVIEMANQHALEHADCTRKEVLDLLKTNGAELVDFVAGLDDEKLDRKGYLSLMEKDVSAGQFLEMAILGSGGEHFNSIKAAGK